MHLFTAERTLYVILTNTSCLYSCVMFGKGISSDGVFIERAFPARGEFMKDDGRGFAFRRFIAPAAGMISFARALRRAVTGSMNDLVHAARGHLASGASLHEVGRLLNETPLSAIDYRHPREAFTALTRPHEQPR